QPFRTFSLMKRTTLLITPRSITTIRPTIRRHLPLPIILAGVLFSFSGAPTRAAAPPAAQGAITFRTYPGDQRPAIRAGTAVPDGTFYPKRMEGPYNGYPDDDPGDDTTLPVDVRDNYNMHLLGY